MKFIDDITETILKSRNKYEGFNKEDIVGYLDLIASNITHETFQDADYNLALIRMTKYAILEGNIREIETRLDGLAKSINKDRRRHSLNISFWSFGLYLKIKK